MKWTKVSQAILDNELFELISMGSFKLSPNSTVFTIGSCFAREVEDALKDFAKFPTLNYRGEPSDGGTGRTRGILNKFTPETMNRELIWVNKVLKRPDLFEKITKEMFYYPFDNEVVDIGLHLVNPVSEERFSKRRASIFNIYKELMHSDTVIITLGNLEQLYLPDGRCLESILTNVKFLKNDYKKLTVRKQSEDEITNVISDMISLVRNINSEINIVFTVSPIPMQKTWLGDNIVLENLKNKLFLRAAAQRFAVDDQNVYYFPSYEMVSFVGLSAFESDLRHVKPKIVKEIMKCFTVN